MKYRLHTGTINDISFHCCFLVQKRYWWWNSKTILCSGFWLCVSTINIQLICVCGWLVVIIQTLNMWKYIQMVQLANLKRSSAYLMCHTCKKICFFYWLEFLCILLRQRGCRCNRTTGKTWIVVKSGKKIQNAAKCVNIVGEKSKNIRSVSAKSWYRGR